MFLKQFMDQRKNGLYENMEFTKNGILEKRNPTEKRNLEKWTKSGLSVSLGIAGDSN